jgi:hypothetical protein
MIRLPIRSPSVSEVPASERSVARAAIEARYREFIRETESAMQLDRLAGDAAGHLVARDPGHRPHQGIGKSIAAA